MRSFIKFNTIQSKLIVISLSLLLIPLVTLGVISFNKAKTTLDESGAKRLEYSVEMTIEMIEALNKEVEKGNISLDEAQEKVKVALLGEKDAEGNRPINANLDIGENGYTYIIDQDGFLVAHPNIEGENIREVEDNNGVYFGQEQIQLGNEGGGLHYYEWPLPNSDELERKVNYIKTDPHWNWVIAASTYMSDFNAPANSILTTIFILTSITLIVGILIIWIFANRISKPIYQVSEYLNKMAEGDLSQEQLVIHSNDETGHLANALNQMQEGLRSLVGNIINASESMTSSSEELTQASHEVSEGTEQMSMTMEELASGSETQANRASNIATMTGSFLVKVEEANKDGEHVQQASEHVLEITEQGRDLMNTSTKQMDVVDNIVHDAVEKVEGLDAHSQEISKLVSVIQDIAEQTNLLALNAAIEAARAGEAGQGFSVVADEVRKLAEESADSVTDITEIVNRIQAESSMVASSLREGYQEVEEGTNHIMTTGETFSEIENAITDMGNNINRVSENLVDIVENSEELNSSIEDIAAISEESAAGVEEATATTEETSATMQEVAGSSEELANLAEKLNEMVSQFKL